jgi:predicted GIY-YIG superfamily endonuclease
MPFVYILRCSDNTFYVGHTNNLITREHAHNDGTAAQYTACRRPVKLVYSEEFAVLATAIARGKQLKRWSSQKKEALITHNVRSLKQLSKRRKK